MHQKCCGGTAPQYGIASSFFVPFLNNLMVSFCYITVGLLYSVMKFGLWNYGYELERSYLHVRRLCVGGYPTIAEYR